MKTAIIAVRVSTEKQAKEGYSLASQLDACRAYAARHGITVVREFEEVESGAAKHRPVHDDILAAFKRREADTLIVHEYTRFSRSELQGRTYLADLWRMNVEVHEALKGRPLHDDWETVITARQAQDERENIRERTIRGRRSKAAKNKLVGTGSVPYGYDRTSVNGHVTDTINEAEAEIVREIYQRYVNGDGVTAIARDLTARRIATPGDRRIKFAGKKRDVGEWSEDMLYSILDRSAYRGKADLFRYASKKGEYRKLQRPEEERIYVDVPAIVSPELWAEAERYRGQGKKLSKRRTVNEYLMRGRIRCGCGYKIKALPSIQRSRRDGSITSTRYYYVCLGRVKATARPCTSPYIPRDAIDTVVWEWLYDTLGDHDKAIELLTGQYAKEEDQRRALHDRKQGYIRQLDTVKTEQQRLLAAYTRSVIELDEFETERGRLKAQQSDIEAELGEVAREEATLGSLPEGIEWADIYLEQLFELLDAAEDSFEGRRRVVDKLDLNVEVLWKNGEMHLHVTGRLGAACIYPTLVVGCSCR